MQQTIEGGRARVTGGFWGEKRELVRTVTLRAVYDRFTETGRFSALKYLWREGMPNKPHIFYDSDVAKWIEAAAYFLRDARDPALEALVDEAVDDIARNQAPDGYYNAYYGLLAPGERFTRYTDHELYCLGHLLEAGVAYDRAVGKGKLLACMSRYVDLVDCVFRVEHAAAFDTPGHEEIELALYRAWQHTGEEKYLTLMRYFINTRGTSPRDNVSEKLGDNRYAQSHLPVRAQFTAEGHSVRACYLYCAMADLALHDGDAALRTACERIFQNITRRRMYVTGGVGSTHVGEAFTADYDLMNRTAYAETCAAIALALFARRMSLLSPRGAYADIAELALYNGALAGLSLDGRAFFYENPLEMQPVLLHINNRCARKEHMPLAQRAEVFSCSCCPPNIARVIGDIASFALSEDEGALFVHQYMPLAADTRFGLLKMETAYPCDGAVTLCPPAGEYALCLRVPGWAEGYDITINGKAPDAVERVERDGYLCLSRVWRGNERVLFTLPLRVRSIAAHPALHEDCGRVAIARGPLIYCLEQADNGENVKDIALSRDCAWEAGPGALPGVPALFTVGWRRVWGQEQPLYLSVESEAWRAVPVTFIPYYAWANRGENEMTVWVLRKPE